MEQTTFNTRFEQVEVTVEGFIADAVTPYEQMILQEFAGQIEQIVTTGTFTGIPFEVSRAMVDALAEIFQLNKQGTPEQKQIVATLITKINDAFAEEE